MKKIDLSRLEELARWDKETLWDIAGGVGREPKIYLHWTAGHYGQYYDDYHINIDDDGQMYTCVDKLSEVLAHTYCRNTGAIGIALCGCYGAGSNGLGDEPPTSEQIEQMARCVAVLCDALDIPCDKNHVMTHGEAAANEDGLHPHEQYAWWADGYGDGDTRGDLEYLGTDESPEYNPEATDGSRGGDVIRGKAIWYQEYGIE